ncbi:MAG: radical SAM protein [candidate division FCPU426 bacterium]
MKVLLVEPPVSPYDIPTGLAGLPEPLALESIASKMREKHEVDILDMRLEDNLDVYLRKYQPDVVGVGSVTANHHLAKKILSEAKKYNREALTIIGGHHVTFMPQDANESYIDVIVVGEGDFTAANVVDAFSNKEPLDEVQGIVINRNGNQIQTKPASLIDMDVLPLPSRDLVSKYRTQYFQRTHRPIVSINSSRGCPYKCKFCSLWKMNRGKYRTRSAELVVNEIEGFKEDFVDFIDDNSLENINRANKIADLIIERRIEKQYKMYSRATTVANNPKLIEKLSSVGLKMLLVGFESIMDNQLNSWNKKSTFQINQRAIEILKKNNVEIAAYFVVDPQFGIEEFESLSRYVNKMGISDPVFTILIPFPGTDLYEERKHEIYWNDYRIYDFFHTVFKPKLPLEEFYDQFSLLYKKSYLKANITLENSKENPSMRTILGKMLERIHSLKSHHINVKENANCE